MGPVSIKNALEREGEREALHSRFEFILHLYIESVKFNSMFDACEGIPFL